MIAQGLSAFEPERVALSAGRIMLARIHELGRQKARFAFETTLASRTFAPWIEKLILDGYQFPLVFLWLPDPQIAVNRVSARVASGGHHVPAETIRRRYNLGLTNFFGLYQSMTAMWEFWDNSDTAGPTPIAFGEGPFTTAVENAPTWDTIRSRYAQ